MKPQTKGRLLFMLYALVCAIAWTAAFGFIHITLVSGWIVASAGVLGCALLFPLGQRAVRRLKDTQGWGKWMVAAGFAGYIAFAAPVGICLLLGVNMAVPSGKEPTTVVATTTKYTTRENEYRTVGRRRVYKGEHNVYHLRFDLPDGRSFSRRVNVSEYVGTRSGRKYNVTLRSGALGFDIVGDVAPYRQPDKGGKKASSR